MVQTIQDKVAAQMEQREILPRLLSIVCSEEPASLYYAQSQKKFFEKMGMAFEILRLGPNPTEKKILEEIEKANRDTDITGIIVVMPVPKGVNRYHLWNTIDPRKDVEGITPANMGRLYYGNFQIAPCTAKAIWLLLQETEMDLAGKEIVVISHSEIIGKPLLTMLLHSPNASPTVTCCHIATKELQSHTKRADVVVVAVGKAGFLSGEMIRPGAIVIDVGINMILDESGRKKIVGDSVGCEGIAAMLTPVPGGVGAVTTAVLLENCMTLLTRGDL